MSWEMYQQVSYTKPFTEWNKTGAPVAIGTSSTQVHTHTVVSGDLCTASDSGATYPLGMTQGLAFAVAVSGAGLSGNATTGGNVTWDGINIYSFPSHSLFSNSERRTFTTPVLEVPVGAVININLHCTLAGAVCDYVMLRSFPSRIGTGLGPSGNRPFLVFYKPALIVHRLALTNVPTGHTVDYQTEPSQRAMVKAFPGEDVDHVIPTTTAGETLHEGAPPYGAAKLRSSTGSSTMAYDAPLTFITVPVFDELSTVYYHRLFAPGRPGT